MSTTQETFGLAKSDGRNVLIVKFKVQASGDVRVLAYGTCSDYTSDQTISKDEARAIWSEKVASGYSRKTFDHFCGE